jgi:hypothetical protein
MQNRNSLKEGYISWKKTIMFVYIFNVCLYFKKLCNKKWFPLKENIEVFTKKNVFSFLNSG